MEITKMRSHQGNIVPNQYDIQVGDKRIFKSYESNIVMIRNGKVYLDSYYWNYSNTTGRYRNMFLGEDKKTTEMKIKSGEYILTDLTKELDKEEFKFFKNKK
jgi:co-chaperonin GroES (HSP10)